jgi:DNA-binding winged helix-turn-helix (wHTH) protein
MSGTIGDRIARQPPLFVGRDHERAALAHLLDDDGAAVAFIHGIGGIGKSALLDRFLEDAATARWHVLRIDGATIEPTSDGVLTAITAGAGEAGALAAGAPPTILAIDRYELLGSVDGWLRDTFVPELGEHVRLVIAGRDGPVASWAMGLGGLFEDLRLENLRTDDALRLLRANGVPDETALAIERHARGHPLSLRLAASAVVTRHDRHPEGTSILAVTEGLTDLYLANLDAPSREAVDAASMVRRPTLSLLAAMLPETPPHDAFDRLSALPFVDATEDGLALHDTVREVVANSLRENDPDRSRRYRTAAWRRLREEVTDAPPRDLWRYTADLLYMLEDPEFREGYFPTTERRYMIEPADAADWSSVVRFSECQYPGASLAQVEAWWADVRGGFRIARDRSGTPRGFAVTADMGRLTRRVLDVDPIARRWRDDLRRRPIPAGQTTTTYCFERGDPADPGQEDVHAALVLDLHRAWLEGRPALRRHYGTGRLPWPTRSPWLGLGYAPVAGGPVDVEGSLRYPFQIDFGPGSLDSWLSRLIATELQIDEASMLDHDQRQLVLRDGRVDLTRLEFELFRYLTERPGSVVDRQALLREVWGYEDAGGSNVLEALVRSLRGKLGEQASVITTVRGVGYRFMAPGADSRLN